jgi:6-phosphogluconolactonase
MRWIEHDYPNPQALVTHVASVFEAACRQAIAARGQALLALAGGRTPLPIYAHLASAGLGGALLAIPGDERCVPHDHSACNLRNLREAFATGTFATDALARHSREGGNDEFGNIAVHPITTADGDVEASLVLARGWLAAHPQPFDAVLLGMGGDGHFASLFPGAANVQEGLALESGLDAIATTPVPLPPEAPFPRISLTLPRLLHAQEVHLVVTGQDKRAVLRHAQQDPHAPYPVATLLHAAQAHPIHIHWSP